MCTGYALCRRWHDKQDEKDHKEVLDNDPQIYEEFEGQLLALEEDGDSKSALENLAPQKTLGDYQLKLEIGDNQFDDHAYDYLLGKYGAEATNAHYNEPNIAEVYTEYLTKFGSELVQISADACSGSEMMRMQTQIAGLQKYVTILEI